MTEPIGNDEKQDASGLAATAGVAGWPEGEPDNDQVGDGQPGDASNCREDSAANQDSRGDTRLDAIKKIVEDLQDKYLRAAAETENMRRRCAKDIEDAAKYANSALAKDIIAFVDNLERAVVCRPTGHLSDDVAAFIDGVSLIAGEVLVALERHGIKKIETNGADFNPDLHQAISEVESADGAPSGTIVETLQTGYTINGRLLRAAMVIVAR
jgi:molecular chaperone GrpE